ncbi:MAG: hypothetical protein JWO38_6778 [Gemmataceae bacterium]|nr:hypothetical protein [Gemmataceae bacterium]
MPAAPIPETARKNIQTVRDLEAEFVRRRTRADRLTDAVTEFVGSFRFLVAQMIVLLGWVAANVGLVPGFRPVDRFPFEFLNLAVGIEAILLSTFVLMTQNRQTKQADHWGHLQLQVSLLAEQEATKMLQMLQMICDRLGLDKMAHDPELKEMIRTTHVEELAKELEKARDEVAPDGPTPAGDEDAPDSDSDAGQSVAAPHPLRL